jgi:biotin carboxyl carrier protein
VVEDVTDDDGTFYPSPGLTSAAHRPATPPPVAAAQPAAPLSAPAGANDKLAPMGGTVVEILIKEGERVEAGRQLLTMEAMKMKQVVTAHKDGAVSRVLVKPGEAVDAGQPLVTID